MKKIFLFVICMAGMGYAYSQSTQPEVIATAGDYYKGTNYTMSWTLGECVTETFASGANTLTQGFQQSTYAVTAVKQPELKGITVKAYPNPTTNFITVSVETTNDALKGYSIELFDVLGKHLMNEKLKDKTLQVDMSIYRSGSYLLRVSNSDKTKLQTFKIEKN